MSRKLIVPEDLQSFGIELEFNTPTQSDLSSLAHEVDSSITYDVSAQEEIAFEEYFELPIYGDTDKFYKRPITTGGEFITDIWNTRKDKQNFSNLVKIIRTFESLGEAETSPSAGIHFHLAYPRALEALQNIVLVMAHLEKFFFSVGGLGNTHRCLGGDAIYYRPITRTGPIVVPVPGGWAQCFSVGSLMRASSLEEFFQRYGDTLASPGGARYPVVRYHYLNLLNMAKNQRTVEIRVFNTSLDPLKIWSMLKLFQEIGKYCASTPRKEVVKTRLAIPQSVFSDTQEDLENTLDYLLSILDFRDSLVISTLEKIVSASEPTTLKDRYVRSHLHDRHNVVLHWKNFSTLPEPYVVEGEIHHPYYMDSFVLSGEVDPQHKFGSLSQMFRESVSTGGHTYPQVVEYEFPVQRISNRSRSEDSDSRGDFIRYARSLDSTIEFTNPEEPEREDE
jgi:hypothetical protein